MQSKIVLSVAVAAGLLVAGVAMAAEPAKVEKGEQRTQQATGREMMSAQERNEHRAKMRNARDRDEREKMRAEHHEKMKVRAAKEGKTLPGNPPAAGMGGGMGGMGGGRR